MTMTAYRQLTDTQAAYSPPRIPVEDFRRLARHLPPRAWWLFAAGLIAGWMLRALIG